MFAACTVQLWSQICFWIGTIIELTTLLTTIWDVWSVENDSLFGRGCGFMESEGGAWESFTILEFHLNWLLHLQYLLFLLSSASFLPCLLHHFLPSSSLTIVHTHWWLKQYNGSHLSTQSQCVHRCKIAIMNLSICDISNWTSTKLYMLASFFDWLSFKIFKRLS